MVWDCLLEISYGEILAYGDIAKAVGHWNGILGQLLFLVIMCWEVEESSKTIRSLLEKNMQKLYMETVMD